MRDVYKLEEKFLWSIDDEKEFKLFNFWNQQNSSHFQVIQFFLTSYSFFLSKFSHFFIFKSQLI